METIENMVADHPFMKGLDPNFMAVLARGATEFTVQAGQFIFREGEEADKIYLVRRGKVALEVHTPNRGAIIIQTLGEGDLLGWSWFVPPYRKRFDARATELVRGIVLDGSFVRAKCEENHNLGYELIKRLTQVISQRLQGTRMQLLDLYTS
jgi:CRP/FNR family transcriptional regulator, cyclic AMP receptor protein